MTIKKEDITCAFHKDLEDSVKCVKGRINFIIIMVVVNAMLTGAHIILKLPAIL